LLFDEITASSLVKIDLAGRIILGNGYPVNPAGFTIHSAIHAAREDAQCVLHVHTQNGVAVSAQRDGLLPMSQQSLLVLSSLAYHDYEGIAVNPEEKVRLVADIGDRTFLMLRNHGLLVACAFRRNWPLIPIEAGHPFRWKPTGDSDEAGQGGGSDREQDQ
jgi:ribulose-5-phosphate 4-epimerase/fuculose-1-phosphate aldolase